MIKDYFPGCVEEFITELFHGIFASNLREASQQRQIEDAFLYDLKLPFPQYSSNQLSKVSNGLIANIVLHRKSTEKVTGGDLSFMIIKPQVTIDSRLARISDYRRGILCQAKMKDEK